MEALSTADAGAGRQPVSKGSASHADSSLGTPAFSAYSDFWHSLAKHSRGQPRSPVLLTACAELLQGSLLEDAGLKLPDIFVPLSPFLVEEALRVNI